ncbi:MAG: type IV pilus assembly protein PilM [Sedimentisphaerales bacterium]|nr:type IV pilus assembly protein PilM [Sedimentisphaerales bacterium]
MLNLTKIEPLGLDIGSFSVKAVRLHKDESGYSVAAAGITEIAEGGKEANNLNTVKAIRECFELMESKTKLVVCGLSGPEVAVRDFEFPSLSASEIEGAVLFEASQVCPFSPSDSTVDYHLITNGDDKTRGVLVAATNTLITGKVNLAKEAALKCALMDVDGLALLNCFTSLTGDSENSTTAILNVGGSCTTVAIMGSNGRPFIRDMTFAGNDIISQIATDKNMSAQDVKKILFDDSKKTGTELNDNLGKACSKLVIDISKTLRYYAAQEYTTPVKKIFVCGGFALINGFVELLNSRLGVEVVLWNPFDKIRCDDERQFEDICAKKGPALAVAAGLAMRSV